MGSHFQQKVDEEADSEVSSLPDHQVLAAYVHRPLRFSDRPPMTQAQKFCTYFFYAQVLFQLLAPVGLWMTSNATLASSKEDCPVGYVYHVNDPVNVCITSELAAQMEACNTVLESQPQESSLDSSISTGRRLEKDAKTKSNRLWALVGRHKHLPVTTLLFAAALCVALLVSLAVAAACVTYTVFAVLGLLLIYGFYLSHNWMLLVVLAVSVALAIWRRADIQATINAMKVGAEAIKDTPAVFCICAALQLVWFVYALVFVWFTTFAVSGSVDLDKECQPTKPTATTQTVLVTCPLLFVLTTFFFRHCILAVTSLAVGAWCFREEAEAQGVSATEAAGLGFKYAFTTSCGSVFAASCILTVVDVVRKKATGDSCLSMLSWCDPVSLLARVLWCALESTVGALTRFALIGHMFQGDGLCHVASITGDLLKRRLPGLLTCGVVAEMITDQISWMTATVIGFFTWWYLDAYEKLGLFSSIQSMANTGEDDAHFYSQLLLVAMTLAMVWCVRHPIMSLLGAFVLSGFDDGGWNVFLMSVALGSLVAVIFNYFTSVLEFATDAALYCMVLEAEGGQQRNVRLKDLHTVALELQEKAQGNEDPALA